MTEAQLPESSPYTDSRTERSPHKTLGMNYRNNYGIYSQQSSIELNYLKLKQESKRQAENYLKEIDLLKQQLYRKSEQIEYLKSTVIMNLKKDLNDAQRDNIKNFKQSERQARQIEKLRTDNFNMQQDLQKQSKDRRSYLAKLDQLKGLKQSTKREIIEKDKIIRTYSEQNKKLEKELLTYQHLAQDLEEDINERKNRLYESQSEYNSVLQRCFLIQNQLKSLKLRQQDNQLMIRNYQQKICQLEKDKQELLDRIQQYENRSLRTVRQPQNGLTQVQIIQIKALMDQIYNSIEEKSKEKKDGQKKFLASISTLDKALRK